MIDLARYRTREKGLADILEYDLVADDGIIMTKKGLMAGFYYRGVDIESSTNDERNHLSAKTNFALSRLGSGYITHHDAIRIPAGFYPKEADSFFPDPISKLIDAERRAQFKEEGAHYESLYVLIVTYIPPVESTSKFNDLLFSGGNGKKALTGMDKALSDFKETLHDLQQLLSTTVSIHRMKGVKYYDEEGNEQINDQLLEYINYCLTGKYTPVNLPPVPMFIDQLLAQEFIGGMEPVVGDQHISVVSIDGFPQASYQGILNVLDQLPLTYRWSTRFIYLDQQEADQKLKAYRRKWKQKERTFFDQLTKNHQGTPDEDAIMMVQETNMAIAEAASNLVTYGYYTSVIVLMDESRDEVNHKAKYLRDRIRNLGFGARVETVNTIEAWLGSLPGHFVQNVRRPHMHTLNLADLLPLTSVWAGLDYAPCSHYPPNAPALMYTGTTGSTPFRFNLHAGDVGHTLIFGPTGKGKSTLLALIAAQFRRYQNSTITVFDMGRSMMPLLLACGGHYHDFNEEEATVLPELCPLSDLDTENDKQWAQSWIETIYELQHGGRPTPEIRNAIYKAIDSLSNAPKEGRTLSDYHVTVQDSKVKSALEPYLVEGSLGHILDASSDNIGSSKEFEAFEMKDLMEMGEVNLIPILLYLFHRFEKSLKGQPALLILDEAWIMLAHPVFKAKIKEWLRTLRRANCAVIMATQSLTDAVQSDLLSILQENCPTKVFLPNESAMNKGKEGIPGPYEIYLSMGLNDRQIEIIQKAKEKREYYLVTSEGRRLIDLNIGELTLSFIGVSSKNNLKAVREAYSNDSENWTWNWLKQRGVNYEQYL